MNEEESSGPSMKLGLGMNGGYTKCGFTTAQLRELEYQSLIFKYIAAGLPVPIQLIAPVWKSVASSFGGVHPSIYQQYPSFIGFSPRGFDYRNMMEPEPRRCRRTDGKKWRCGKNVVPNHKYCERHIHRGQRSRKPVEATSEIASPSSAATKHAILEKDSEVSNTSLQLMTPSSNDPSTSNNNNSSDCTTIKGHSPTTAAAATTATTVAVSTVNQHCKQDGGEDNVNDNVIMERSRNNVYKNVFVTSGFIFSPKSVLQGGTTVVALHNSPSFYHRTGLNPEAQPRKCRRTDGKKWRCSKDVVPDQKYCVVHMHRGAKKRALDSEPVTVAIAAPPMSTALPYNSDHCGHLNTNLSISIPKSPSLVSNDEKSGTTPTSSDTTTTTTAATPNQNLALSP